jgi:hypothetical protein
MKGKDAFPYPKECSKLKEMHVGAYPPLFSSEEGKNVYCPDKSKPAPTSEPCRMDGVWMGNTFSLYSCPITNHHTS